MSKKSINNKVFGKYLNRPIGENEGELLNKIWGSFSDSDMESNALDLQKGYQEVKERIKRRRNVRKVYFISSFAAAAVLLFIFVMMHNTLPEEVTVYAQLNNMGVSVSNEQVQLMVGDSMISNLGTDAKINIAEDLNIELQSANGETIRLQKATALKIYVPMGKHFNLELADGTLVVLNADTWFEYPSTFDSEKERRVKIKGEGFFEVQLDNEKPFYVEMPNGESIRVLGTSFNVSSYEDNLENVATLLTGKISYHVPANNNTITLLPNEQLCVNKQTAEIRKNEVDALEYSMWKEGVVYFNNERLVSIAKKLSRMYGIEVNVSEAYHNSFFSGMILYERGVDHIIKLVTTTSNIECTIENGVIYLK